MKHLRKIILSILTIMMVFLLTPYGPLQAEDEETESYDLVVGGVEVTSENKDDILNDGGKAKFDPANGTLILDNPSLRTDLEAAIYAKDFTLHIEGNVNAVGSVFGIYVENGRLTIDSGTIYAEGEIAISSKELVINHGKITAVSKPNGQTNRGAVYAENTIAILDGELNATAKGTDCFGIFSGGDTVIVSGKVTADVEGPDQRYGVHAIRANGTLDIQGGDVTATAQSSGSPLTNAYGLYAGNKIKISDSTVYVKATNNDYNARTVYGNAEISGGDVTVIANGYYAYGFSWADFTMSGGKLQITTTGNRDSYGINAYGPIKVSDGELIVTCTSYEGVAIDSDDDIIISGGKITATASGEGSDAISQFSMWGGSKIEISGGEVHAYGKGGTGSCGIFTNQPLSITGGIVESNGDTHGIYSSGLLKIGNGIVSVTANGKEKAIYTENKISLGNELTIKEPKNGKLNDNNDTIVESNGKTAKHALIVNDNKYTITVKESENGTVTVSRTKANGGVVITLTVKPKEGCELDSITVKDRMGNDVAVTETEEGYEFTMPESDVTVTATFIRYYSITVSEDSKDFIEIGQEKAAAGDTVTVSLKDVEGYRVKKISAIDSEGNITTAGEDNSFVMPASDVIVTAQVVKLYDISIEESENGTVTANVAEAEAGETVTLTVDPEENCELDSIVVKDAEGNAVSVTETENGYEFGMPESDATVTATFIRYYNITVSEDSEEFIEIEQEKAAAGETVAVIRKDVEGYRIKDITVKDSQGNKITVNDGDTFTMPDSEVTVTAEAVKLYNVTINETENGTVTADKAEAEAGEVVTLTVSPEKSCKLDSIVVKDSEGNAVSVTETENGYEFSMPESDATVSAEFVKVFTITFDLNGGTYNGKPTYSVECTEGTVITLPEPIKAGYTFEYWQGSKYYSGDSYTVIDDHSFKAIWKKIPDSVEDSTFKVPKTGIE